MATILKTQTLGDRTIILTDGDPSDGTSAKIGSLATDFNGLGLFLKTGASAEEWASIAVNMSPGDNWLEPATTRTNTPGSTVLGVRTLVGAAGTGAWATKSNQVAIGDGAGGWTYEIPVTGNIIEVTDTISTLRFTGTAWTIYPGTAILQGGNRLGAAMRIGTNDAKDFYIRTTNVDRIRIGSGGGTHVSGNSYFGDPTLTTTPSARLVVAGSNSAAGTYTAKFYDVSETNLNFYIENDGKVNSRLGYWIGGYKTAFASQYNVVYWRGSTFPDPQSILCTIVGTRDGGGSVISSAAYNTIIGNFPEAGGDINLSGGSNIIISANHHPGVTSGIQNILFNSTTAAGSTQQSIGFGADNVGSNEVVFGANSQSFGYYSFWFGRGKTQAIAAGANALNFYATSSISGETNSLPIISEWRHYGGSGTGNQDGTSHVWFVAPAGASGTANNSWIEIFRIGGNGKIKLSNYPTSDSVAAGELYVADAATITGNGDFFAAIKQ